MHRVAVAQYAPDPNDPKENLRRSRDLIAEAAAQEADLVVLPELALTGYLLDEPGAAAAVAEPVVGGWGLRAWSEAAARHRLHLVAGFVERGPEGRLYNSAAVIGPGGVLGVYRKLHLFDWERRVFAPGDGGLPVFDLPWGRIGVQICYDLRFVEATRLLALRGVDLLCVPTTWTDLYKPQPFDGQGWCMANHLARAHAYVNRIYVACANRIGREREVGYLGASLILSPQGRALAGPASRDREALLVAEVDPHEARDKSLGPEGDLWGDRRADVYRVVDLTADGGAGGDLDPTADDEIKEETA
ncbi:MAG TPA: nitrilase-related carbon-nitrogen hydrolase [Bacillota bacterium]